MSAAKTEPVSKVLDAVIIGSGFSGLCAAIKLREKGINNIALIEKGDGVGGTWRENTYPGAACDVPSPLYCYSFEPNPEWSRLFSPQPEIRAYIRHCADKYGITPLVRFNEKVKTLRLDDAHIWNVELHSGETMQTHHVINGSGGLHKPMIPDFAGLESFEGPYFHTATWNHDVDLDGKRVIVIGSAASAIQVIPEIAKVAAHVTVMQRTPNYIARRGDIVFSDKDKAQFRDKPETQAKLRQDIFDFLETENVPIIKRDPEVAARRTDEILGHMRGIIKDPDMRAKLTPDYELGCKRILLSDNFYETLTLPHVDLVASGVERIEENAVIASNGERIEADVTIMATGFDLAGHAVELEVLGEGGHNLATRWINGPDTLNGACVPGFPNLYWVTGPNTGVATNSVVFMVEAQVNYIVQAIELAGRDKTIEPTEEVVAAQDAQFQADLKDTVWASGCNSWYLGEGGAERIGTLYPYDARRFAAERATLNVDEFLIKQR